jgi:hypothetical protein
MYSEVAGPKTGNPEGFHSFRQLSRENFITVPRLGQDRAYLLIITLESNELIAS